MDNSSTWKKQALAHSVAVTEQIEDPVDKHFKINMYYVYTLYSSYSASCHICGYVWFWSWFTLELKELANMQKKDAMMHINAFKLNLN